MMLLPALPGHARVRHGDAWARENFARAERMREALNGRPAKQRARRDYQRVIDSYRRVYFGAPTSSKGDASVVAVAELQVEMGRQFDDNQILQSAVKQYEFLRKEYPGSKYRFDALFTIGEIYKDDLGDPEEAQATFEEFLRRYPRNRLSEEAKQAIAELNQHAVDLQREVSAMREAERYQKAADLVGKSAKPAGKVAKTSDENDDRSSDGDRTSAADLTINKAEGLARVTSIRHWSTPDYTRVAIDLEQDVKFASQRIDHPDRIFFDLYDTKLASTLVGKSFDVDDGFLRKIRVAQFKPGKTRVVLEVDDLSDYDAFLLPNPSRLIIDIHGKQTGGAGKSRAPLRDSTRNSKELLATADTTAATNTETGATDSASMSDSSEPAKVAKVENTKPTVETVNVGKHPVKRIIEAPDDDESAKKMSQSGEAGVPARLDGRDARPSTRGVARKVEDLRPDVSPVKSTVPDNLTDAPLADEPAAEKKTLHGKSKRKSAATAADIDVREARPTAAGDRSLIRALGLKIGKIVIDPGHGGHDTGTIGPDGLLETRLGAEVIYTRKDDTFIPLETRTAIANQEQADLFVSIHANSSRDPNARGVETYYLNFTSSPDALEVAARENAVSEKSIHELGDLVKKIALKEKIEESHEFASNVQEALHSGLATKNSGIRDRGVKKAPFIVLIGANMPSILAEISFVSNPSDERKLQTPEYRQRIAESLYRGISKYVSGLSGVKLASKVSKEEGQ